MAIQTVFKRYELKYMITPEQKARILLGIAPYMSLDQYGRTTIRNLYFDTADYRLIRRSIEKPDYKEKLRVRSYCSADRETPVFVELKKKYEKVVYKRRLLLPEEPAMEWLCGRAPCPLDSQISREIDYFLQYYGGLRPTVFLSYEREAYYTKEPSDFRVTFDENVLCRQHDLSLMAEPSGTGLLPEGKALMELKCPGGMPLWMVEILSREKLYKTSFSKYGTAYQNIIFTEKDEEFSYV